MELGKRRKSREHLATSSKGNVFTRNKGVHYEEEENRKVDAEKGRHTSVGLGQLVTPDPEKYGQELEQLHKAAYRQHRKELVALSDEELFEAYETNRHNFAEDDMPTNAYLDAMRETMSERLDEPRFQSPIPMPYVEQVTAPLMRGLAKRYNADAVYHYTSQRFTDEDLGLTDYNPPFLPGETQDSPAWQVRKSLGSEAQRRNALTKVISEDRARIQQELKTGSYKYYPDPEPKPKLQAAPAGPPPPPGGSGPNDSDKKFDYYKQPIPNVLNDFAEKYTDTNKKKET